MKVPGYPSLHLAYCQNVHTGETWRAAFDNIRRYALEVRDAIAPGQEFGLGLRLSAEAARTLAEPGERDAFRSFLERNGLYVFTVNGFPYGAFHGTRIKEQVYAPDWKTPERLAYTIRLADILAGLLPEGVAGSISTVPGSYGTWIQTDADETSVTQNLMRAVEHLVRVQDETGHEIHLGLEPEPDCYLENTDDAIRFFESVIPRHGVPFLATRLGCGRARAREAVRRHLGLCFDTCHALVQFENPVHALERLASHAIRISKVQVSAALHAPTGPERCQALAAFTNPVYLHQVRARTANGVTKLGDLAEALTRDDGDNGEWRVHCHVPLYFEGDDVIQSTAFALTPACFRAAILAGARHFEMETYTFDVLPASLRARAVSQSVIEEYRWFLPCLVKGADGAGV
jgi:sugar phosphate isomerase/epimerase